MSPADAALAALRDERQYSATSWARAEFGDAHVRSVPQRAVRFLEEAIELYQALTAIDAEPSRAMAHKLVDYIFDRKPGEPTQEIGGVSLTLLVLCQAMDVSADACELAELERVLAKPLEEFGARNRVKNAAGFDVTAHPTTTGK